MVDVGIHYSFEAEEGGTRVNRWLSQPESPKA